MQKPQIESAALPWQSNPYALVSWLEMEQFSARAFYLIGTSLREIISEFINAASFQGGFGMVDPACMTAPVNADSRGKALTCLRHTDSFCEDIGLTIAAETIKELRRAIETNEQLSYAAAMGQFNSLDKLISKEMNGRMFMYVPAERAKYYGLTLPFGEEVAAKFPSVAFDAIEAGNCLAAARSTACVFHLMRTLEIGLRVLGAKFDVSLEHTNWGPAIDQIEKKVRHMHEDLKWKALPDCKEQQEFYSQATSYLGIVKDAWRNYTAHVRGKYTEEEADLMLRNVKAFMNKLSERLCEDAK